MALCGRPGLSKPLTEAPVFSAISTKTIDAHEFGFELASFGLVFSRSPFA
jgi:hypothetical protein